VTQHHRWTCLPPLEVLVESGATLVRTRGYVAHVVPMPSRTCSIASKPIGARRALAAFTPHEGVYFILAALHKQPISV